MLKISAVEYVNPFGDYQYILVHRSGITKQYKYNEQRLDRFYVLGLRYLTSYRDSLLMTKDKVIR